MTYNFVAKNIGVDSGVILLSDEDFYGKEHQQIEKRFQKVFKVARGKYKVDWKINNTMMGDLEGFGEVNITSGKLVVSDPCYIVPEEKWDGILKDTNYFQKETEGTMVLDSMGGDGCYTVELVLEKI